jgi:hypothetical protein
MISSLPSVSGLLLQLHERTRGEDIFNVFLKFVKECNLPLSKLVAITTDGAPSTTGRNNGFLALCAKDESFPNFLSSHCVGASHGNLPQVTQSGIEATT